MDTNVLVRFLVDDDRTQHLRAVRLVETAGRRGVPLFVGAVVFCELVWVLNFSYKVKRPEVIGILRQLLHTKQLEIEGRDALVAALERFERGRGDFADYVVLERARAAGADSVATFDRALLKEEGFREP